jgi:glucosyl-dolichyl phosphate glucuronosyltransferase
VERALHLSVAVCTWNRADLLRRCLDQMTRLTVPPAVTWELLVVNNLCTDSTDEVIESFSEMLPVRRLFEPVPGLSNARNRALTEATGDYVLWTDDDVLVDEDWLAAYARAFRRWPDASIFGGPIEPLFEGEPPAWLPPVLDQVGAVFGRQRFGAEPVSLSVDGVRGGPYGGNMALRRAVLLGFGFDPQLGVRHGHYSVGEETDLIRRLLSTGLTGWWTPEPLVRHWIPRRNQTLAYVRRWMIGAGRFRAQSLEASGGWRPHYRRHRLLAWMIRHEVQYQIKRHVVPPERWIRDLIQSSQAWGQLQVRMRRPASRPRP